MSVQGYYETYWQHEHVVPDKDPTTPARKKKLAAALSGVAKGARVLDLGCGSGYFTAYLQELGYEAVGADLAAAAVETARGRWSEAEFHVLGPDGSIPLSDESVEAVWSTEVIEHVFDVHAHLSEVNRVLRPGGLYVLTTPFHGRAKNILIAALKFDRHFDPEISHIRFFDRASLDRVLRRAGFAVETWSGVGRAWPLYRSFFVTARKTGAPGPAPTISG